jgi:hypothetical protein
MEEPQGHSSTVEIGLGAHLQSTSFLKMNKFVPNYSVERSGFPSVGRDVLWGPASKCEVVDFSLCT